MKKKLLALAVSLMMIASLVIGCVGAFAEPGTDYVDSATELNQGLIDLGFSIETADVINGTQSLAFSMDVSAATNTTWCSSLPLIEYPADLSEADYFGFRVKNTDTANNIGICALIDFVTTDGNNTVCRYLPTRPFGTTNNVRLFDKDGNEVQANLMTTLGNGIGTHYLDIPAGFEGTLYFYMKDNMAFENKDLFNRLNAPYNNLAMMAFSFQADDAYHGKLIFDDVQLATWAELKAQVGDVRTLVDVDQTKDIVLDCFATNIGGGSYSTEKGETMVRFPLPANSTQNLMQVFVADLMGYESFSFRLINDSDEELPFISTNYNDGVLNALYTLYDAEGNYLDEAVGFNALVIPANFDGWVTLSLIEATAQGGSAYEREVDDGTALPHPWEEGFAGKYLDPMSAGYVMLNVNSPTSGNTATIYVGDIVLNNGSPVQSQAEPDPTPTPEPQQGDPTPTPDNGGQQGNQQGGNDNPSNGAISLIGFAVAAVVAGAVIVRKKHN